MAEDDDQNGHASSKFGVVPKLENLWKQQQALPLWLSTKEAAATSEQAGPVGEDDGGNGKLNLGKTNISADSGDECGLELSLGLSLGGRVSKSKFKNVCHDDAASDQACMEKAKEENRGRSPCSKDYEVSPKRILELGPSCSQPFWQELTISRESLMGKLSPEGSDALCERLLRTQSADTTLGTGLPSLGFTHAEKWSTIKPGRVEESTAVAHNFWQDLQANATRTVDISTSDDKPLIKDLLRARTQTGAASYWDRTPQVGVPIQLLNGFRDIGDVDPVMKLSPAIKMGRGVSFSGLSNGSPGQECGDAKNEDLRSCDVGLWQQSIGEVSSQDESVKASADQQQVQIQDASDEIKKHSRQVARKKRKALLEEQKLQKKAKKDVVFGQSVKQLKQTSGMPTTGSKITQLTGASREVCTGTREVSSSPDSQDGEMSVSGFRRSASTMWHPGSVWEGPAACSPEPPADSTIQNEDRAQRADIHKALQHGSDRAVKDKSMELNGGLPRNLHPGGDLVSNESVGAASASSDNGLELRQGQADSSWVQSMADLEGKTYAANQMAAALLDNNESVGKRILNRDGIRRRGDLNVMVGRSDTVEISRRDGKYMENQLDTLALVSEESPSTNSRSPLSRELSLGSGQITGGLFTQFHSSPSLPCTPQFGPLQPGPDSRDNVSNLDMNVDGIVDRSEHTSWDQDISQQRSKLSQSHELVNMQRNRFQQGTTQSIPTTSGLIIHVGQEASSLKVGIAAGQMFGGTGSSPDLPWVTCTGAGPNGKTICGVLYRYQKGQVRIVCACHGSHMSPTEFVEHAGIIDLANPEKNIVVGPFSMGINVAPVQTP